MKIVQITPGAGNMYCGACFRDHALVQALRRLGHDVTMTPLYLPASLEEASPDQNAPIFFGGISVYLEQKTSFFAKAPLWLRRALASKWLLNRAASRATTTQASELGEMTISMLQGEEGRQSQELEDLSAWLKPERPELISLSNALLVGMARRLKSALGVPVVCSLQGEDSFLDGLSPSHRDEAWNVLAQRAKDIDLFIAPSEYFASLMARRLNLTPDRVKVVYNGIDLRGYEAQATSQNSNGKVIGYFARMCKEKGLETFVQAYIQLRQKNRIKGLKMRVGGYCGPSDHALVAEMKERLRKAGVLQDTEFCPNLSRDEKLKFLKSLSVFSSPAIYSEAFGLYVIEALASGVPVVQPNHSAFPELIEATEGGVLCKRNDPQSLADELEALLTDPIRAQHLGAAGQKMVFERFGVDRMAKETAELYQALTVTEQVSPVPQHI